MARMKCCSFVMVIDQCSREWRRQLMRIHEVSVLCLVHLFAYSRPRAVHWGIWLAKTITPPAVANKQSLDEVFVISRIIEVEVGVIPTETSIILDITKTYYTLNGKKLKSFFCFFADAKQHKARELDMITLRNHAPRSYMTWLPMTLTWLLVTLTWLLYNLQLWCHRRWFRKFTVPFRPIRKEIASSMYNNITNCSGCLTGCQN